MSFRKVYELANKFHNKIAQDAGEVASEYVTLAVRPSVNDYLKNNNFNAALMKVIEALAKKGITGNLNVTDYITNASATSNKWKVDPISSGLKVDGSLAADPSVKSFLGKVNVLIAKLLEVEFNRLSAGGTFQGSKITNHETQINNVNIG